MTYTRDANSMRNIYYLFSVKDECYTELSLILKKKNVFDHYYGLACARMPCLENSVFSHISYLSDMLSFNDGKDRKPRYDSDYRPSESLNYEFLKKIEETYNVRISDLMHADRHFPRFKKDKRLFIAQEMLMIFINDMNKFNINLVVVEGIDDFISFFASIYCKYHGIKYVFPTYVGYTNRTCFSSNIYCEPDDFRDTFHKVLAQVKSGELDVSSVDDELTQHINTRKKPSYMTDAIVDYKPFQIQDIKTVLKYFYYYYFCDRGGYHYDTSPLAMPFKRIQRIYRKIRYSRFLKKHAVDPRNLKNVNYLIYPLHLEPESSTLILGKWLNDQRKIIEMISKALPVDTVLIVKEHKPSVGRRSLQFYKDIEQYHNVFLVNERIDVYPFIEQSKGVVLISSTMGLEALMLKKPILAFGERYYNVSANTYLADNFKELDQIIAKMLQHKFDEDDRLAFFHALLATTTDDMGYLSHLEYQKEDLEILADKIEVLASELA